jgi:tetratricopeptide (TPR) repeat protein
MLDFDANKIADARLIRTFPLTQVEMNSLEIEHRGAWNLYANKRYAEAFESFSHQAVTFRGNYLSPYWAAMSALKLKNLPVADAWFNMALEINPYFTPARNAKLNASRYVLQDNQQQKKKVIKKAPRRSTRSVKKK